VQTYWFSARNNCGVVRQESTPQSATFYTANRYQHLEHQWQMLRTGKIKIRLKNAQN
jgi:hypothetical protein